MEHIRLWRRQLRVIYFHEMAKGSMQRFMQSKKAWSKMDHSRRMRPYVAGYKSVHGYMERPCWFPWGACFSYNRHKALRTQNPQRWFIWQNSIADLIKNGKLKLDPSRMNHLKVKHGMTRVIQQEEWGSWWTKIRSAECMLTTSMKCLKTP